MIDFFLKNSTRIAETVSVFSQKGISLIAGDNKPAPQILREAFEELGTTYIKLGQFIASTPSIFPEEFVKEFQKCLDQTRPLPFSDMEKVLKSEIKKPLSKIFREINPNAIASASIAQVHEAILHNGDKVVLKIQKPNVMDIILTDMNLLYFSSKILEVFFPSIKRLSLSEIIEDLQHSMIKECDFILEAKHTKDFRNFLNKMNIDDVIVPYIYDEYTTSKVITMEKLQGIPLRDPEIIKTYAKNPQKIISRALQVWFLSLIFFDFFHADVHAGNLLLLENEKIAFIDFGIIGRIQKSTWNGLQKIMIALESEPINFLLLAEGLVQTGIASRNIHIQNFARDLENSFSVFNNLETFSEEEINEKLLTIVKVAKDNGIRFPREFGLLLKQFLYFDRYIKTLAPNLNILEHSSLESKIIADLE